MIRTSEVKKLIGILEIFILIIPLSFTTCLSILNLVVLLNSYRKTGETTILNIAIIFLASTITFFLLDVAIFFKPVNQPTMFLLANIFVWIIFFQINQGFLSAFLNNTHFFERYLPGIFGSAIFMALLGALFPERYFLMNPYKLELGIFLLSGFLILYIFGIAWIRITNSLTQFEGEEARLLISTRRIIAVAPLCVTYTFISVYLWLTTRGLTNLTLNIEMWNIIDWITYFNVPIYLFVFLGVFYEFSKLKFEEIDIPNILNTLDSPKE